MAKVLCGTTQKVMTAFDQSASGIEFDKRFNIAILCQSVAKKGNLWQAVGRILRAENEVIPQFIWIYYPMKAYDKHLDKAIKFLKSRQVQIEKTSLTKYSEIEFNMNMTLPIVYE